MLQSLPVTLAAIVFIMYASTFAPRSAGEMERSIALVESVSYYQICAGGKPVVWFKSLGDSCTPEGMTLKADTAATTKRYATGCWVNKYPLFPSCPGLLLTANADSTAWENVAAANKDIRRTLAKAAKRIDGTINQLKRKIEETDYYMKVHNVNDDGYNIMAVLAEDIKRQKAEAEKLAATLKTAAESGQAEIRIVTRHTLIYRDDTAERPVRKPCVTLTKTMTSPVTLLQTADNTLIVDAYNANPTSMKAAIDNFRHMEADHKMLILGDMGELGAPAMEEALHRGVGLLAAKTKPDILVCVGERAAWIGSQARFAGLSAGAVRLCPDLEAAQKTLAGLIRPGDLVLLKASRFMKLERLLPDNP